MAEVNPANIHTATSTIQIKLQIKCKALKKQAMAIKVILGKKVTEHMLCLELNDYKELVCIGKKIYYHWGKSQSFRFSSQCLESPRDCSLFLLTSFPS